MTRQRRHFRENELSREQKKSASEPKFRSSKSPFLDKWNNKVAIFVSFNIIVVILSIVYFFYQYYLESVVTTPLKVPKVVVKSGLDVPSMYWGTYRPGLYFGMQTRSQETLSLGLMWFTQKIGSSGLDIRHWCDQWSSIKKYSWLQHDGENFGIQEIVDEDIIIVTSFVKRIGGQHGGDFTVKITVEPKVSNASTSFPVSLLFYAAAFNDASLTPYVIRDSQLSAIHGHMNSLGHFSVTFNTQDVGNNILKYNFLSTHVQGGTSHLKEAVLQNLAIFQSAERRNQQVLGLIGQSFPPGSKSQPKKDSNFLVHQVTFTPPFEMEISFESGSFHNRPGSLVRQLYNSELTKHSRNFETKFAKIFDLPTKGYTSEDVKAAQAILSNMLGGIGYFYGSSLVQSSYNKAPVGYWKTPLFTAVPSRSFFPRGFLWDEGFHNLLILQWNPEVTKDILSHWLDLMNMEGWIPREQILGLEARERVPSQFIVQKNTNANPPTFFITLEVLLRKMKDGSITEDVSFFKRMFPRLKVWYEWFNKTQVGMLPGTYRWQGRDAKTNIELNPKTLTSGLDDFPRASHPTIDERHIDLRCWMAFAAGVLADISDYVGEPSERYRATHKYLSDNKKMDEYHWSPTSESYSDYGFHTNKVKLVRQSRLPAPGSHDTVMMETVRVVSKEPRLRFIDNFGYVSLFPFLLKIIEPNSPKLGKVLRDIKDPKLLWSNYGLRSLAENSPFYMKHNTENDPPYWRGAIWININFLAVCALHHYSQVDGPFQSEAQELYTKLRETVVTSVIREYKRTGYVWENYNDKTGKGQGAHPFTGWSSLVVLMMGELY